MVQLAEKSLSKKNKEDRKISIAIMSSFAILTIQYLILTIFNLSGTKVGNYIQLLSKGIVGIFYLLSLPVVLKRNKIKFIAVYFISIMILLLNCLIFKENVPYIKTIIFPFFFTCLPTFIYAYSIENWNVLKGIMNKVSLIVFIIGTLISILVFTGKVTIGSYSMSLSYYMLLPTIIYMDSLMNQVSFKSTIRLLTSLIIILALGSRGAIMCTNVFVVLKLIELNKKLNYKTILSFILITGLLIIILVFLKDILEYIYNLLLNYGIKSRSIQLFLKDEVYLSGRDRIYKYIFKEILNAPFLGLGLAADRRILTENAYTHNIFIEILLNFGLFIGGFINILLLYLTVKSIFIKDVKKYSMIIIWMSIGFVHFLVSSSYLIDFRFWIFLGLCLKCLSKKPTELN